MDKYAAVIDGCIIFKANRVDIKAAKILILSLSFIFGLFFINEFLEILNKLITNQNCLCENVFLQFTIAIYHCSESINLIQPLQ